MKKLITIVLSCSLALAVSATAETQKSKNKKKGAQAQHAQQARPAAKQNAHAANARSAAKAKGHPAAQQHTQARQNGRGNPNHRAPVANKTKPAHSAAQAHTNPHMQNANISHGRNARAAAQANTNRHMQNANVAHGKRAHAAAQTNVHAKNNAQAATVPQFNQHNKQARKQMAQAKKPNHQRVKAIRSQHQNFHAQARPAHVRAVSYNHNYRIHGAQHWQGARYSAFRNYRAERHDRSWYHSHYDRVELIGGGYYYLNAGYWYPAWGYAQAQSYYAYDGPIYVGQTALPPDQVIANVQTALQDQGYYEGDVDGLLGPLTRQALTNYQEDNGLYSTAAIDEPTLDSLGMNG